MRDIFRLLYEGGAISMKDKVIEKIIDLKEKEFERLHSVVEQEDFDEWYTNFEPKNELEQCFLNLAYLMRTQIEMENL